MKFRKRGERVQPHNTWSPNWIRSLSDQDLGLLCDIARQQIEINAPISPLEMERVKRTLAEQERRQKEGAAIVRISAAMTK